MKRLIFAVLLFVSGCSSTDYILQEEIRTDLSRGDTQKALQTAKSDYYYVDDASEVVKNLELGNLYYLNGSYYQALQHFDAAQKKSRELYTQSLLNAVSSAVTGDRNEDYRGETYEMSLLRFYQSLCHYQLYLTGVYESRTDENGVLIPEKKLTEAERRKHLRAARAVMLDWDSLLQEYKREYAGQRVFKQDMAAKLWGGYIHEQNRLPEDRQIARQLYKDAPVVLFRNYNLYPSYNEKFESFAENFETLHTLPERQTKKEFVSKTDTAKRLEKYAEDSLKKLTERKRDNVFVLMKTGRIGQKKAEKVTYVVPWFLLLGSSSDQSFKRFVSTVLPGQIISFEIPYFDMPAASGTCSVSFKNKKGKTVAEKQAVLIEPVSEISAEDFKARRNQIYAEKAASLAAKHAAALAAAYLLYDKNDETTLWIARLSYTAAALAISASEDADLRYWGTLPANIWLQSFNLKPATYEMTVSCDNGPAFSETVKVPAKGSVFKDLNLN